jgi:hypothetical protein
MSIIKEQDCSIWVGDKFPPCHRGSGKWNSKPKHSTTRECIGGENMAYNNQ